MADTAILDELIVGRVEPRIYAFTTNTVPNYLKVGDTYRPVEVRLDEWREHYPQLKREYDESAKVADDVLFRDYSVHAFLEETKHCERLTKGIFPGIYFSNEFFKGATKKNVVEAITDIQQDFDAKGQRYQFYRVEDGLPTEQKFASTGMWKLRPNQAATVKKFKSAIAKGRKNLLMYAVMRFGKSFTSMCCAKEMNDDKGAKLVLVLSAKADVRDEWRRTVESADNFRDEYEFLSSKHFVQNPNVLDGILNKQHKKAVVFITLQDLQTPTIKKKYKRLFKEKIDLLLVDETHYGARAGKYGEILRNTKNYIPDKASKKDGEDKDSAAEMDDAIKAFKVKVTIHLSGTPYRILMGSEFEKEDIIAFCQFTDIVKGQKDWDEKHKQEILDDERKAWENPYYGFPEMVRFAFHPNESTRKRLDSLRNGGVTYAFSALFEPVSVKPQENSDHRKFKYEREILDLFQVIDGSKKDENLLGFLDYDKIKNGKMCHHIVCVLPYCASCDALESLLKRKRKVFKNLADYRVINISGHEMPREYADVEGVRNAIADCEKKGQKTLTLTVNRMLTGSTVPQWDTMLYFKDTASPQEYDQAIFRLQNQFVQELKSEGADGKPSDVIKFNKKPQTLLVDFDPARLFRMQEEKSKIYNVNEDKAGNSKLEERIREELKVSPVVCMNAGKIHRVEAAEIMEEISNYSRNRGVADEASKIDVDVAAATKSDALLKAILKENPLGDKKGFVLDPSKGDGEDLEVPDVLEKAADNNDPTGESSAETSKEQEELRRIANQFRAYCARILFFAFLTKSKVQSLEDIVACMDAGDNSRIAANLRISKKVLKAIQKYFNRFILSAWDYKIANLNKLSRDESLEPLQRATTANSKFDRLGESEIVTPGKIADDMVALLPEKELKRIAADGEKILDISGKTGEFAIALYKRYQKIDPKIDVRDLILTIPTSSHAYEFTRKVYEALGLNLNNIAEQFTAYDLIAVKNKNGKIDYERIKNLLTQKKAFNKITMNDKVTSKGKKVKIAAVIGNPPYQHNQASEKCTVSAAMAGAIYPNFIEAARIISPSNVAMITPSRWMTKSGRGISRDWVDELLACNHFVEIHDFPVADECFDSVELKGGVNYFYYSDHHAGACKFMVHDGDEVRESRQGLDAAGAGVVIRDERALDILAKVAKVEGEGYFNGETFASLVGPNTLFCDCAKGILNSNWDGYVKEKDKAHSIKYYLNKNRIKCGYGWIRPQDMIKGFGTVNLHKVFIPEAYGAGEGFPHQILGVPFYGEPGSICSQTYICIGYDPETRHLTEQECRNIVSYIKTRFFRFMVYIKKRTQHSVATVYQLVPMQDFSQKWTDAKLYAKYGITKEEQKFIESMIKPME